MEIGLLGKLLAGGILGVGLLWMIWNRLSRAEATAVENAGRKAQQEIEAEADAAQKAIQQAVDTEKSKTGPVTNTEWKF